MTKCIEAKVELYKNADWLRGMYLNDEKSGNQIAKECYVNGVTIRRWLHEFNIPVRSYAESASLNRSNHVILTGKALEFLIGELLGDGHLDSLGKFSACFMRGSSRKNYLEWVSRQLALFGIGQSGKILKQILKFPGREKDYICFHYSSKRYVELKPLHSKWYRKARKDEKGNTSRQRRWVKVVPRNLELTPLTCLMWYLGDGCVNSRSVNLNTLGFSVLEVDFLRDLLGKLGFETTRFKSKIIHILTKSAKDFLNYIGECPVKCYKYKWQLGHKNKRKPNEGND